jgi:acyl-coenzyme A synthetase/AMP-(fatty) acid ligase
MNPISVFLAIALIAVGLALGAIAHPLYLHFLGSRVRYRFRDEEGKWTIAADQALPVAGAFRMARAGRVEARFPG